jgi:hypothetical protein
MTERIEQFYHSLYKELASRLGCYIYKDVDVVPLAIAFYINTVLNSKALISQIERVSSEKEMERLVEHYFEGFFKPKANKLRLVSAAIFRYAYHRLFHKSQKSNADFFVFITNKKFFSFVKPISEALEKEGKKVEFLLWDKKDSDKNFPGKMHLPQTDFPAFLKKGYCSYYGFTTLIDRANGFLPLLKNKKLILIEGDLESQHILGLLGRKNQFETYCLQWGFFGKTATKPGWRNMPFGKLLVWGDFFADNFRLYNPSLSIDSCGHPSLNENIAANKAKVILFAVQKQFGEHITTQDVLDFIRFAATTAMQMPDYKIIVRSHPDFEIPESIKREYQPVGNIVWHDYKNFSLGQSFDEAKYCVSISSTVSLESVAYGCYPLYLKINKLPLQVHQLLAKDFMHQHVFDAGNFIAGIQHLGTQDLTAYLADFKNKLYKNLGNAAVAAIVSGLNT